MKKFIVEFTISDTLTIQQINDQIDQNLQAVRFNILDGNKARHGRIYQNGIFCGYYEMKTLGMGER